MKEPFIGLTGFTALVLSSGAVNDQALAERIGAVIAAGTCSGLYSWWKSRKRKADRTDTAIWSLIALFGSMSFGWFVGPAFAEHEIMGVMLPGVPVMTLLFGMSGAPAIEWLLDGSAFKWARRKTGMEDVV